MSRSAGMLKRVTQRILGESGCRAVPGQPIASTHPQVGDISMHLWQRNMTQWSQCSRDEALDGTDAAFSSW